MTGEKSSESIISSNPPDPHLKRKTNKH